MDTCSGKHVDYYKIPLFCKDLQKRQKHAKLFFRLHKELNIEWLWWSYLNILWTFLSKTVKRFLLNLTLITYFRIQTKCKHILIKYAQAFIFLLALICILPWGMCLLCWQHDRDSRSMTTIWGWHCCGGWRCPWPRWCCSGWPPCRRDRVPVRGRWTVFAACCWGTVDLYHYHMFQISSKGRRLHDFMLIFWYEI